MKPPSSDVPTRRHRSGSARRSSLVDRHKPEGEIGQPLAEDRFYATTHARDGEPVLAVCPFYLLHSFTVCRSGRSDQTLAPEFAGFSLDRGDVVGWTQRFPDYPPDSCTANLM